jgi:hypothetical protein
MEEPMSISYVLHHTGGPAQVYFFGGADTISGVSISPATGWSKPFRGWPEDLVSSNALPAGDKTIWVPLSEIMIFREPGHYELTIHLIRQGDEASPMLVSNTVGIDVVAMPPGRETELVEILSSYLATGNVAERRKAAALLGLLTGDEAIPAKLRWVNDPDVNVCLSIRWGLDTTLNQKLQLQLLEDALMDVRQVPNHQLEVALTETRCQLRHECYNYAGMLSPSPKEPDESELQARRGTIADFERVIQTLPSRKGENRRLSALFLIYESSPQAVTDDQMSQALRVLRLEGGTKTPEEDMEIFNIPWSRIRDVAFVPGLRRIIERNDVMKYMHCMAGKRLREVDPKAWAEYGAQLAGCSPNAQ